MILRVLGDELDRGDLEILDVGCGTGTMLAHLSRFGRALGIDADPEAIRFCRDRGVRGVRHVPEGPLPFAAASFDVVTALDVVEHIDDDRAAVAEMARVLRPGGRLLLTVPAFPALWGVQDEIAHHRRRYRAAGLQRLVTGAGLDPVRVTHFNTVLLPPIAAVRLARRILPRRSAPGRPPRSDFTLTRPGRLNDLLARVFAAEAPLVARGRLPAGVSLLALARKAYSPAP